jgi:hypothetical protein
MASAKDIAVLERKLKEAKSNREKIVLAKELKDLKSKLSTTQKQDTLPTQRRKIRMLSSAEFNELIARLKQRPEYSFLKSMGKGKIADDYRVVGKPVGWRIKGKNNYKVPSKRFRAENPDLVYYENRTNRSDVRRPNRLAKGGNMDSLMTNDIKKKWKDYTEGDSRGNFASYDSILKEIKSANFYGRAYRPKTGSATIHNTLNLLKQLGVIYEVNDMRKPISQRGYYLKNNQMATGGSLKKKDVKHPKAFKIDLDVESRMGNNEHFEVGKMRGYGDALVSRSALQHNAPDNYKYSVKATNKYAKGGGVKKKDKTQPAPTPNANLNPMDSYNVELIESQGKDDKGTYYMFPKPANDNSRGVLFEKGGEIEENAKFKADNPNWTNEKLLAEYEKLNVDLRNFNNGFLKPKQIIGGGYKSSAIAKKIAKQWLEDRVAEYKMALEIRGVMAKGGMTKKEFQAKKMGKVMHEFKQGDLHSGKSGNIVKNREQAIAIGLSEAKRGWKNRK